MAGNQFKRYLINNRENALFVLKTLISQTIINLDKFKKYTEEAMEIREQYADEELIPGEVYESCHDKTLLRERELLSFVADEANDTFSYKNLRKELMKKGLLTRNPNQELMEILNELHTVRNGTFHNSQSRLVAEREVAMKKTGLENEDELEYILNLIVVGKYQYYAVDVLERLINHNKARIVQVSFILGEMKRDYQDMFDQLENLNNDYLPNAELLIPGCDSPNPVRVLTIEETCESEGIESDASNVFMAIQKGKYDGTLESFESATKKGNRKC